METFRLLNAFTSFVLRTLLLVGSVRCHGRLWEPPSRSTMWRLGYNTSVNINDNELNCGGFKVSVYRYTTPVFEFYFQILVPCKNICVYLLLFRPFYTDAGRGGRGRRGGGV